LITIVAFVPVLLVALSYLRSTVLSKYLDEGTQDEPDEEEED